MRVLQEINEFFFIAETDKLGSDIGVYFRSKDGLKLIKEYDSLMSWDAEQKAVSYARQAAQEWYTRRVSAGL